MRLPLITGEGGDLNEQKSRALQCQSLWKQFAIVEKVKAATPFAPFKQDPDSVSSCYKVFHLSVHWS